MKIAHSVLAMAAAALPPHLQARYREEWEADLLGAEELGMRRSSVLWGAVLTAFTLSSRVEFSPLQRASAVAYWARWAMGAQLVAYTSFLFLFWLGGDSRLDEVSQVEGLVAKSALLLMYLPEVSFFIFWLLTYYFCVKMLAPFIPAGAPRIVASWLLLITFIGIIVFIFSGGPIEWGSPLLSIYFGPLFLAFLFYLWAKASGGRVPNGAVSSPSYKKKILIGMSVIFVVFTFAYTLLRVVLIPLVYRGSSIADVWQSDNWNVSVALIVARTLVIIAFAYFLAQRLKRTQRSVGLLCLVCGLVLTNAVTSLNYATYYQPHNTHAQGLYWVWAFDVWFMLVGFSVALGFLLLVAPRVRSVEAATWEGTTARGVLT